MRNLITICFALFLCRPAAAIEGYIFVSSSMPKPVLLSLAKEAGLTGFVMVLNGFGKSPDPLKAQSFAQEINKSCCAKYPPTWIAHPPLFDKFAVKATPTFVLEVEQDQFVKISGDMGLGNALKYFAQESTNPKIRDTSLKIYKKSFQY